jgi:hypothetical protein
MLLTLLLERWWEVMTSLVAAADVAMHLDKRGQAAAVAATEYLIRRPCVVFLATRRPCMSVAEVCVCRPALNAEVTL